MDQRGTLELLAEELGSAFAALQDVLRVDSLATLFYELGLDDPPAVGDDPQFVQKLTAAADQCSALATALEDLAEADDLAGRLEAVAHVVEAIVQLSVDLDAVATDLKRATAGAANAATIAAFAEEMAGRLLERAVVRYLETTHPALERILAVLTLVEVTPLPLPPAPPPVVGTGDAAEFVADAPEPVPLMRRLHLDRLGQLLQDPLAFAKTAYDWGEESFDGKKLFVAVSQFFDALGPLSAIDEAGDAAGILSFFVVSFAPTTDTHPPGIDGLLHVDVAPSTDLVIARPSESWRFSLRLAGALGAGLELRLLPPAELTILPPEGTLDGEVRLGFVGEGPDPQAPFLLFGQTGGSRLQARHIDAGFLADLNWDIGARRARADVGFEANALEGKVVIDLSESDGFLASVLPASAELDFDLGVLWSEEDGLTFRGGAGLALEIPLGIDVGPARLDRLDLAIRAVPGAAPALAVEARLAGGVTLGPFGASVDGIGVGADLLLRGSGDAGPAPPAAADLGPVAVGFRFVPPTGLGLSIDAGPGITGGGFIGFDESTGRYSGQLQLSLGNIAVDAVGLLDTRLPGGAKGFSLLVLLRASFPPIQVGFGFTLTAVGGLLALNRRVNVDALRSRMASGTAGRILAPEDPVRNAPMLLSDLAAVFPPAEGVVVVGPTLQLFWLDLVRFDIGLFFELPGPTKIVVLGSARATIEHPSGGRPYLQLRMDILGVADLAKQTLEYDAVLLDSHLLEILELTGGAAYRLSVGAEPYLVLTVGGFHPAYSPAPLVFPASLTRVAMTRGTPTDDLYFRFEGYLAVTTNSLQFGASVEVIVNAGSFNIRGFLGFDALIRFLPFHFNFTICASVKVRWKGRTLAALELGGELSGPGPVVFRGKVCIEILFFDICFEETFTLGSLLGPVVTAVASAVAELLAELVKPANLRAAGAADPFVAVAPAEAGTALPVVSPVGQLAWSQERAPLDLLLQRFEGAPLTSPETVSATGPQVTGPDEDWFAPGGFAELFDADALNRRAFERLRGGVRLGVAGTDDGPLAAIDVQVKQVRIPNPPVDMAAAALPGWVLRAAAGRAGTIERDPVVPALGVRSEAWVLRGGDGAVVADGLSQAQAHQLATVAAAGTAVARSDTVAAFAF
jgi:hypothetical protein